MTAAESETVSMPPGLTRADFYTGRFCLTADVQTGDRRLIEALRDPNRHYLEVRRVRAVPLEGSDAPAEYGEGLLSKSDIEWAAIRAEPPRAEARLYGFVKKAPVRVALIMRTCRIEGSVHVESGSTDPIAFFLRGIEKASERFLAVTGATITPAPDDTDGSLGMAIVNRTAVRLFSVLR